MTQLHISMALTALTITLAPQAQAYAAENDPSLVTPVLARIAAVEPLQSEPGPAICEMDILQLLAQASTDNAPLTQDQIAQLACHDG